MAPSTGELDRRRLRQAEEHLLHAEPIMGGLVDSLGPCGLHDVRRSRPFAALVESIVHQQLSIGAAATIHGRLLQLFDGRPPSPGRLLGTPVEDLRAAGLSRQKVEYLRDLAARVEDGRLPLEGMERREDEEIVDLLTGVKGIGRWTADMFLIFRLGRLDVLPVGDLGLRDVVRLAYGLEELPGPARMVEIAEPWRPYRSVASWYLWRSRRAGGLGPEPGAPSPSGG